MKARRTIARTLIAAGSFLLVACDTGRVVAPESGEPFLYLVLNHRSISDGGGFSEFVQHGLLLTAGSALESPRYRNAQRFEMRSADGGLFDWRIYPNLSNEPGTLNSISMLYANYYLPDSATATGLGTSDIVPGESYTLNIETEGELIRGSVTVPDTFTVRLRSIGEVSIVTWSPSRGAGGYRTSLGDGTSMLLTDTVFTLPAGIAPAEFRVEALDANLYRYVAESESARAGIDSGFGVFGAVTPGRMPGSP